MPGDGRKEIRTDTGSKVFRIRQKGAKLFICGKQKGFASFFLSPSLCLYCQSYCSHVHSNQQKSMKIACGDGIFACPPRLSYGQRSQCADLPEQ